MKIDSHKHDVDDSCSENANYIFLLTESILGKYSWEEVDSVNNNDPFENIKGTSDVESNNSQIIHKSN
jgi:hypothetical protein